MPRQWPVRLQLQQLSISMAYGKLFGDGSVAVLGAGLRATLRQLSVNAGRCALLGDGGVAVLGAGLPAAVRQLIAGLEPSLDAERRLSRRWYCSRA